MNKAKTIELAEAFYKFEKNKRIKKKSQTEFDEYYQPNKIAVDAFLND